MTDGAIKATVALGIIALFVALIVPGMIGASQDDVVTHLELDEGETRSLEDADLNVTLDDVDQAQDRVNVTVRDLELDQAEQKTINVSETATYNLSGENVNVTPEEILSPSSARLEISFSVTYGWDDGPKTMSEHIPTIMVLLSFLMIFGLLKAVA